MYKTFIPYFFILQACRGLQYHPVNCKLWKKRTELLSVELVPRELCSGDVVASKLLVRIDT